MKAEINGIKIEGTYEEIVKLLKEFGNTSDLTLGNGDGTIKVEPIAKDFNKIENPFEKYFGKPIPCKEDGGTQITPAHVKEEPIRDRMVNPHLINPYKDDTGVEYLRYQPTCQPYHLYQQEYNTTGSSPDLHTVYTTCTTDSAYDKEKEEEWLDSISSNVR